MKIYTGVILFLVFLTAEAFFAGAEIALIAADRTKLKQWAKKSWGARIALRMLDDPEWLLTSTLLGLNVSVIGNGVFTTAFLLDIFPHYGSLIAALLLPPTMLLFGQLLPKSFAQQRAEYLAPRVAPLIYFLSRLLFPLIWAVSRLIKLFTAVKEGSKLPAVTREEIRLLVSSEEALDPDERRFIERLLEFSQKNAAQVMLPIVRVKGIEEGATVQQALQAFVSTGFSRLVVYRRHLSNIVGFIMAMDFLDLPPGPQSIRRFVREVLYVPETKPAAELLAEMQREGRSLCVVVDEYAQASGIITIEDLVEEILGEFFDEFDPKLAPYVRLGPGHFLVKAWLEIERIRDELGLDIPPGDYETIGGFVLKLAGRIPRIGERLEYDNLVFQIRRAHKMGLEEIEIWVKKKAQNKKVNDNDRCAT